MDAAGEREVDCLEPGDETRICVVFERRYCRS